MDTELLRTVLEIQRTGSMREAALHLHVSQPAVSTRVRELEKRLGVPLFERLGRRLVPTEAGELLAREAPALLDAESRLLERLAAVQAPGRGRLVVATIDAVSIYVLPEVYRDFRRRLPAAQLLVQVTDSQHVRAAVRNLEADVGFLVLPPGDTGAADTMLESVPIFDDDLVWVAAPGHPLARKRRLDLATIVQHPMILYPQGSTTRALVDRAFTGAGLALEGAMETASPEAMRRLAEIGLGIAILPRRQVEADVRARRLARLRVQGPSFTRRIARVVRRGRSKPLLEAFLDEVHARWPPRRVGA